MVKFQEQCALYEAMLRPGGHENHSRRRFFSHLALEPRLPSAWASKRDTIGKEASDFCCAFLRLEAARAIN
jgi:hypothetical protein